MDMPRRSTGEPCEPTILLPLTLSAPCCSTTEPAGVGEGGEGGVGGVGRGEGEGPPPPQPGDGPAGSKEPVHVSQLDADWWHQPVPSSPQSPQSASNLQQPPLPPPSPPPPPPLPLRI